MYSRARISIILVVTATVWFAGSTAASANTAAWNLTVERVPSYIAPGAEGELLITATNLGDAPADGASDLIQIADHLPSGLTATSLTGQLETSPFPAMTCSLGALKCTFAGPVAAFELLRIHLRVRAAVNAGSNLIDRVSVSGGGARTDNLEKDVMVSAVPVPFGVEALAVTPLNEDGAIDTQAGSHPFELTTSIALNQIPAEVGRETVGLVKNLEFQLPAGVVGNPEVVQQCTEEQFTAYVPHHGANECPDSTVLGVAEVTINIGNEVASGAVPLYNLVPSKGEPARFGFELLGHSVFLNPSVRTGRDYGVTVSVSNITQTAMFIASQVTFWGTPGDSRHDDSRGVACLPGGDGDLGNGKPCIPGAQQLALTPFLTLPTSCGGSLKSSVTAEPWDPKEFSSSGEYLLRGGEGTPLGLVGCNQLGFDPTVSVAPDGQAASTPTGLNVVVHVPQEQTLNPSGLAESDVKSLTVALPEGVELSPSAADGLLACSTEQMGFLGLNSETGAAEFTPGAVACPESAKVATVEIKTPLLPNPLQGAMYLASPQNFRSGPRENPFSSLLALYVVAEDPVSGVLIKQAGRVTPDPRTGQLVAVFENIPQQPFETLEAHFFGTARAPLTTPPGCGTFTTTTAIAPWSGNSAATPSSSFQINTGPQGEPCADPRPFNPGFNAESTNVQAGGFTPFSLTMTRPDDNQTLSRIEMAMPPGFSGMLSNVKLCGEPQAREGTCGEDSLIGHTIVSAGLGADPFTVTGGKVYMTTAYGGGQYGLSIVNPAQAGPFVLNEGSPIVVRAAVFVDRHTAALRILSDPLPTILDGIPLQIQHVNVTIDRHNFAFNPTSCNRLRVTGTLSSSEGAKALVSTPFQVTNCARLVFKPKFAVSTSARISRARGASLSVKLSYPAGELDANIAKVKVDLPKQLPSRLTTLQKACAASVFERNPADCPTASVVGHARAVTPLLPVPLVGPAYFVSHGGEAFPSLIVVLQGYGVSVDLVGTTFISHKGITSSTFKAVPDVPVGMFELTLPTGRYSALAANGDLCKTPLKMPTAFLAQNGVVLHLATRIKVSHCPKKKH